MNKNNEVEVIEPTKSKGTPSMRKTLRMRAQAFLNGISSGADVIEMSDRRYTVTPRGWISSK